MIDPNLFTVEALLNAFLDDGYGGAKAWQRRATLLCDVRVGSKTLQCAVRIGRSWLRYSRGPNGQPSWDCYGDDFLTPVDALFALMRAPVPLEILNWDALRAL